MVQSKYIGNTYPIHDAWQKVTGTLIYTGDMKLPHMYYARVLTSNIAHGKIKRINTVRAEQLEGVIKVFTHLNTPTKRYNNYKTYVNQNAPEDERLFADKVRFVGDRVAAVVATSPDIAEQALMLIQVEYDELPQIISIHSSIANSELKIHETGNVLSQAEFRIGNSEQILMQSNEIFQDTIYTQRVHHAAMERHVCLASYNQLGELTIWTPCQGVFGVRNTVAQFLEMNYSDVRVVKTTTGGSFGGKQHVILEIVAAYLAKEVNGSVMLQYSRAQSMLSTITGTAFEFTIETVLAGNDKISAMKVQALADAGAYATNSIDLPISAAKKSFKVYKIPNYTYHSKTVYTNTPSAGGYRGWGGPQIMTAMEVHIDNIARKKAICPIEFRLANLVNPNDIDPCSKLSLGNASIKQCLIEGAKAFNWYERINSKKTDGRFKTGIGLACGGHINGYFGKVQDFSNMILKMNEDGTFNLNTAVHDQGCGTVTSLALIVAEVLDVPISKIKVLEGDTERSPYDMGTYSARVTYVCGKCAYNLALKIKELILERAAIILNKQKSYLYLLDGHVCVKGTEDKKISFQELASYAQVKQEYEIAAVENYSNPSNPGSYACHFAEVEVDTLTGLVKVIDYLAVHDVGRALNKGMVEGQIQGGVQMGIGYALTEEIALTANGYPKATNFDKYNVINMPDMPNVKTLILEGGGDDGPFGAKSVGEAAVIPVMGAVVNAVNRTLGTYLTILPLTPEKILNAIHS